MDTGLPKLPWVALQFCRHGIIEIGHERNPGACLDPVNTLYHGFELRSLLIAPVLYDKPDGAPGALLILAEGNLVEVGWYRDLIRADATVSDLSCGRGGIVFFGIVEKPPVKTLMGDVAVARFLTLSSSKRQKT